MAKPPKLVIPGLNRGAGIPPGYVAGRPPGTGKGPLQLLNLAQLRKVGLATAFVVTQSTSLVQSIAHSETVSLSTGVSTSISSVVSTNTAQSTSLSQISSSLSGAISTNVGQSTSLSQISSSLSGAISSTSSLSTAVSSVDSGQTVSLSQISSSLSSEISSRASGDTSLSTAVSTVDANQSTSISINLSKINSLSTAIGGGGTIAVQDEGTPILTASTLNFVGAGVDATDAGGGVATITIPGGGGGAGTSTSLSQISSSLSSEISSRASGDTSLSTVISSSISTVTSSTTSLSTAVSTVDANQSTSISVNLSLINSLSTAIGGGSSFQPQGRLTLVSATPVMTSDQTAKTTVYYSEYIGNLVPIYDGSNMKSYTFNNLSAILDSTNHKLENLYDIFAYLDTTAKIGVSPAWSNAATITVTIATPAVVSWTSHGLAEGAPVIFTTSGALPTGITAGTTYYVGRSPGANSFNISTSVANAAAGTFVATSGTQSGTHTGTNHTTTRGTGSGTTELELKNGLWTNKNAITLYNNSVATSSISANQATYLGTIYCTANGQTGMAYKPAAAGGGTANILGLYNAYNRVPILAVSRDSTASWTYAVTTWRAANGNVANRISFVDGLQQSMIDAMQMYHSNGSSTTAGGGTNLDNTTAGPGVVGQINTSSTATLVATTVRETFAPQLGFHYLQAMEWRGTGTCNFYGANTSGQLNALNVSLDM